MFPLPVEKLTHLVPHRPPMVWITEVLSATDTGGRCRTNLDPSGLYFSESGIRFSSWVEFMAQAFGFCAAARQFAAGENVSVKDAFLVGMREIEIGEVHGLLDEIFTEVALVRTLDSLSLFRGRVFDSSGNLCASGTLKVYAATNTPPTI